MPLIEPPDTSTIGPPPTIESSTGAPPLSQSIFPPGSLHPTFSGLTLTVHQDPTNFTEEDLEGRPLLEVRFPDPARGDLESAIETVSHLSLGEQAEVLGVIRRQCSGEHRRRILNARKKILLDLHARIVDICRDATVEDYNNAVEEGYDNPADAVLDQVTVHVWRAVGETEFEIHSDDVKRLIYAIYQVMPVQMHDLKLKDLLLTARVDSAPYRG
ncbi:hypothetical protein FFLO_06959 [Filobasidium floriforme]|uniref:Uncharacterized protein n=1 Tax=Filobasidium floriforme TaxID=5210 RepID=A0A8K0JFV7_9TREE|nr:uncharacterized protein HD553DRAFT_346240 [Filobasidium floriforme]KAG7527417.1 hypothetical protein FFLO_06959 [Filobasidium floriforme]KAH8078342.1 hypothetical protein HD553DRAFT_346240 [Filobasidium floriforme]